MVAEKQAGIMASTVAYARAYHATHDSPKVFDLTENLSPAEIDVRYFQGRADRYRAFEHVHFARTTLRVCFSFWGTLPLGCQIQRLRGLDLATQAERG